MSISYGAIKLPKSPMLLDRLPSGDILILLTCDFSTTDTMLLDHILLTRFKFSGKATVSTLAAGLSKLVDSDVL
jgi:hypothetical protein